MGWFRYVALVSVGAVSVVQAESEPVFSRDVLPILSDNCFQCHGQDANARKGDLRLDQEPAAKRVKDGIAAIVPGRSHESEIIKRILSADPDEAMPPPKSKKQMTPAQIRVLKTWIDAGALWGKHWAYEVPVKPPLPGVAGTADAAAPAGNPIDAFVRARLSREGLQLAPEARPETLVRRATLALTGLPPSLEDVDRFLADRAPRAFDRLVDRLLASARFGERMAWDWLDAARYADTNGFQGDPERTMWPWRDWVVKAINDNLPYDQFTIWQLAGDLLPGASLEQKLATGFNRNHMHNGEGGRIPEETRVENVMDRVETTSTIWLGVTMICSKCHDHKFDPFTMRDYYGLFSYFNQTSEDGRGRAGQTPPVLNVATTESTDEAAHWDKEVKRIAADVSRIEERLFPRPQGRPASDSPAAQKLSGNILTDLKRAPAQRASDFLRETINAFKATEPAYAARLTELRAAIDRRDEARASAPKVMIMDQLAKPRDTFMLSKGAYDKPTDKVTASLPGALTPRPFAVREGIVPSRLELARWLVSRENPLAARVTVNRLWQMLFGTGLVKTAEDFGVQGERPSHPELLDWLAVDFMDHGWDVKRLVKQIVTSRTYRQSSRCSPALAARDPENRLLARGPRHRLPSWMIRDQALALSGLLAGEFGGPAVKPYQPEGIWEEATFGKKSYTQDHGDKLYRRSLYIFWRRIVGPTMFFDTASRQYCSVKTPVTNSPLHALVTLNEIGHVEAARKMAERVLAREKEAASAIPYAFRLATSRRPSDTEASVLLARWHTLRAQYQRDPALAARLLRVGESPPDPRFQPVDIAAMAGVCALILNLDEVLCIE